MRYPFSLRTQPFLQIIDVLEEHAYFLDYKNERAKYIDAFY
jgi:superoxide dismutase